MPDIKLHVQTTSMENFKSVSLFRAMRWQKKTGKADVTFSNAIAGTYNCCMQNKWHFWNADTKLGKVVVFLEKKDNLA